ncbi:hypothetical protein P4S64_17045 [Vibrio sp. M60_M31a]
MKKLFVLTSGLLMASSVFASNITITEHTNMDAGTYQAESKHSMQALICQIH